jgi:hypothetical protein
VATSGCGACGHVFGSLALFDAHQHWDRAGPWKLTCTVPPGLVTDARGTWQTPEGLAYRQGLPARMTRKPGGARAGGAAGPSPVRLGGSRP